MIAACLKWVDHRPEVDPLTGAVLTDPRMSGASDADRAALEWALRLAEGRGTEVVAVTAGPPLADAVLREALAAGAHHAVRVGIAADAASADVARAIAANLPGDPGIIVCGAWSVDRGSGSVPAFLAAELAASQALGLISLSAGAELRGERRLDGGRRERLAIGEPAVLSVEGGSARLRRASLDAVLRARTAAIEVAAPPQQDLAHQRPAPPLTTRPYRPRPKVLAAPPASWSARERILALTGAATDREQAQTLFLEPAAAATEILDRLRQWGYLP